MEEAKQILDAFGKIPKEKLQHDNMYNRDYTLLNYRDEADDYLKILKYVYMFSLHYINHDARENKSV